ncbi:E3 ubiquitin ligase PQT3-like [Linum grandiflorum]
MKIKELVDTPALGIWRKQPYSALSSLPPPPDYYVCHRCGIKGHFIQECPTNGDPEFDHRKRMRPTVTLNPAASTKTTSSTETTTTSSKNTYFGGVVPAELHCQLCGLVMSDAVFAKRCCFRSFCDGCIRDHVKKSKSCACGVANVDAKVDDFVPNVTVRKLIKSILLQMSSISSCSSSTGISSSDCSTVITV